MQEEVAEEEEEEWKLADQQVGRGAGVAVASTHAVVATEGAGRHVGPPQGGVGPYSAAPWWDKDRRGEWVGNPGGGWWMNTPG